MCAATQRPSFLTITCPPGALTTHLCYPEQAAPERLPRLLALGALEGAAAQQRLPPTVQKVLSSLA